VVGEVGVGVVGKVVFAGVVGDVGVASSVVVDSSETTKKHF